MKLRTIPMTVLSLTLVAPEALQTHAYGEEDSAAISVPYLKRVLPGRFGIGYNRGITSARRIFFLTVRRMSQCIIICPSCGREIMNDDQVRRTPRGRVVCDECAQDTYLDVPLA